MAKKRRRRTRERERGASGAEAAGGAAAARRQTTRENVPVQLPSATARWTGFMIALVTAFLGGLTLWKGASSGGGANGLLEMLLGGALIALGIAVAALCIAPGRVRDLFVRR